MKILWLSESESELPADDAWLAPFERSRAQTMRFAKRRTDYRLGRRVTKGAVARVLGLPLDATSLSRIEVRNAEDGAPELRIGDQPASLGISISDRAGWGVCAVSLGPGALGCDLELVEPRSGAFVEDYLTLAEREVVGRAPDAATRDELANLFWCAKESALKVLRCGLRRDTRSVEIRLGGPEAEGWHALEATVDAGRVLPGWSRRFGAFLLTVIADAESAPPVSLVEPPALARALPSHAWLEAPRCEPEVQRD